MTNQSHQVIRDTEFVERIAFRVPPCNPNDPELWFLQLEGSFESAGITSELTRYQHLRSSLDMRFATEVKDLLVSPPPDKPYTRTKEELLSRLSVSEENKNRQLLETQTLGDRKPSQFLRHLRNLAGGRATDSFVRSIWTSCLPATVQAILAGHQQDTDEMAAKIADGVMETLRMTQPLGAFASPPPSPGHQPLQLAAAQPAPLTRMEEAIASLTAQVAQLVALSNAPGRRSQDYARRSHSRGPSQSRSRHRSQSRGEDGPADHCWYHRRYGADAQRCRSPCAFAGNALGHR